MRVAAVLLVVALGGCATEPVREVAALSVTAPETIFQDVLDMPLMEGHQLDAGCGGDDPATACVLISRDAGAGNKAFDDAEFAAKVYGAQLRKQGWTPLASPFNQTFMSPHGGRCVDVQAVGVSYDHVTRAVVSLHLDPTAVACWAEPAGAPKPVILPGILDLPVNTGDFLRDYSWSGDVRVRVRFGAYVQDASNPYVDTLVLRGWRIIAQTRSRIALMEPGGGRDRCLLVTDMVVIVARSDRSWGYSEFQVLPDGAPCGLEPRK